MQRSATTLKPDVVIVGEELGFQLVLMLWLKHITKRTVTSSTGISLVSITEGQDKMFNTWNMENQTTDLKLACPQRHSSRNTTSLLKVSEKSEFIPEHKVKWQIGSRFQALDMNKTEH